MTAKKDKSQDAFPLEKPDQKLVDNKRFFHYSQKTTYVEMT